MCLLKTVGEAEATYPQSCPKPHLNTKFARFLMMQMLASMNMSKSSYSYVPVQDFSRPWSDKELYEKYNLSGAEQTYIEDAILPMPGEGGED